MENGRLYIIGLDGADYHLTKQWMDDGHLPNLAGLRHEGVFGCLRSTAPPTTPVAWSSLCTGTAPSQHGVWGFQQRRPGTYEFDFVSSRSLGLPPFWRLLNAAGYTTGIMQVPLTYPASELDGWMSTGMFTPEGAEFSYPPDLGPEVRRNFPQYRVFLDTSVPWASMPAWRLEEHVRALTERQLEVWQFLEATRPCDVYFVVFQLTDWAGHCLGTAEARQGRGERGRRLLSVYGLADRVVGAVLSRMGAADAALVLSDHGSSPVRGFVGINSWLLRNGYMRLRPGARAVAKAIATRGAKTRVGSLAARLAIRASRRLRRILEVGDGRDRGVAGLLGFHDVDWARTRAYCVGTYPLIWINRSGREPLGVVGAGAQYEAVCSEIVAGLEAVGGGRRGEKPISRVRRVCDDGTETRCPDLLVETTDWAYVSDRLLDPFPGPLVRGPGDVPGAAAQHSAHGILFATGPCFRSTRQEVSAKLEHIAPTVLRAFGVRPPQYMDAGGLGDVLRGSLRGRAAPSPRAQAADRQPRGTERSPYSSTEADAVEKRLKQLGYL